MDQPERVLRILIFMFVVAAAAWLITMSIHTAGANSYRPPQDLSDWFESLKRPEESKNPGDSITSCCSLGDAYPIEILEEATSESKQEDGLARVTDPSDKEIVVDDGKRIIFRPSIDGDLTFKFTGDLVVKQKYGNPTTTAWAFLSVIGGKIDHVWCVVPLPPGS